MTIRRFAALLCYSTKANTATHAMHTPTIADTLQRQVDAMHQADHAAQQRITARLARIRRLTATLQRLDQPPA